VKVTVRHLSALNDPNLANNTTTAAGTVRVKDLGPNSIGRGLNDYDGDGKADPTICAADGSIWKTMLSGDKYTNIVEVDPGRSGWIDVPGDYEGDGRTGVGIYVPSYSLWYVWLTSRGHGEYGYLGGPDFMAAQGDFDGDSLTDPAVYRATDGYWLGGFSSCQYALYEIYLGGAGYLPLPADYDGDSLADPAVYNQRTGLWIFSLSCIGYECITGSFGCSGLTAAPADYDGDGITDPAIYNPETAEWQILLSGSLESQGHHTLWAGTAGNIGGLPVPADYDGDGLSDLAVYHQATGVWEGLLSAYGYCLISGGFGGPDYLPIIE
ncbi:MAG: hypothetical protein PHP98_04405, partial [Kiritimatiellae bacterium]|nr:hypothetical protein [Kiritimatiellia bacterium]